jgi:hypothetical protein
VFGTSLGKVAAPVIAGEEKPMEMLKQHMWELHFSECVRVASRFKKNHTLINH